MYLCHDAHVGVGGQLNGIGEGSLLCGSQGSKRLYLLSHLTGLTLTLCVVVNSKDENMDGTEYSSERNCILKKNQT